MTIIKIETVDIQALLDLAEGYTAENGLAAVSRYAAPDEVQNAMVNAKTAIRKDRA